MTDIPFRLHAMLSADDVRQLIRFNGPFQNSVDNISEHTAPLSLNQEDVSSQSRFVRMGGAIPVGPAQPGTQMRATAGFIFRDEHRLLPGARGTTCPNNRCSDELHSQFAQYQYRTELDLRSLHPSALYYGDANNDGLNDLLAVFNGHDGTLEVGFLFYQLPIRSSSPK